MSNEKVRVEVRPNGSLKVLGHIELVHADGRIEQREYSAFCRCGLSKQMPFCDSEHKRVAWCEPKPEPPTNSPD